MKVWSRAERRSGTAWGTTTTGVLLSRVPIRCRTGGTRNPHALRLRPGPTQAARETVAKAFKVDVKHVRVVAAHVGGGFG